MSVSATIITDAELQGAYICGNGTEVVREGLRAVADRVVEKWLASSEHRNPVAQSMERLTDAIDRLSATVIAADAPSLPGYPPHP